MVVVSSDHEDRLVAAYAALAIAIHVLEAGLPSPLPGIKPGLANVIVLIALLRHGWRVAAWVSILRVLAGSLLAGTFLAPAFWLSGAGALASLAALAAGLHWNRIASRAALSPIGLSVISAQAHMAGQFALAFAWFLPHPALVQLLPALLAAALAFGIAGGAIAARILRLLPETRALV